MRNRIADGVRDVDGACAGVDGSLDDAAEEIDLRAPGILAGELHVAHRLRAFFTARTACSTTWSGCMRSLYCMWIGLVAIKVWMRPELAPASASAARSMSASTARARLHTVLSLMLSATSFTAAKSPGLAMAKLLDHVYLQPLQRPGDAQLFLTGHGRAGALLAVAQGGVEDDDAIVAAHRTVLTAARRL